MKVVVDGNMADAVQVAVAWVHEILAAAPDAELLLECPVDLGPLNPPEPMRGSADIVIKIPSMGLLIVCDYKHGQGKLVEVIDNPQTRYYATGVLLGMPDAEAAQYNKVQRTIIQPRCYHPDGQIRSQIDSMETLAQESRRMVRAVEAGRQPDAQAVPGDHCTFCAAAGHCHAKAEFALAQAQQEFAVELLPAKVMDTEEIVHRVRFLEQALGPVESWLKAAHATLHARAAGGEKIPGYKLVPTRPSRAWVNEEAVRVWAALEEIPQDEYAPRSLLSPAQLEEKFGKKRVPKSLYTSVSSGLKLVPESAEGSPAKIAADDEFTAIDPLNDL